MPLVVVCGFPCSGKTTFARKLELFLRQQPGVDEVYLINEESENISKSSGYADSLAEKISRAIGTPMCVCVMSVKDRQNCIRWNQLRLNKGEDSYDPILMEPLMNRFEHPLEKNRWDSPLFTIKNEPHDTLTDSLAACSSASVETNALSHQQPSYPMTSSSSEPQEEKRTTGSSWKAKPKKSSTAAAIGTVPDRSSDSGAHNLTNNKLAAPVENSLKSFTIEMESPVAAPVTIFATATAKSTALSGPSVTTAELDVDSACPAIILYLQTATVAAPNSSTVAIPHGAPDLLYSLTQTTDGRISC